METSSGEVHLGHLVFGEGTLTVLSGFAGRPIVLEADDVDSVLPAADHPDVVGDDGEEPAVTGPSDPIAGES
ncbi:MAG: hypothetical protein Q8R60_06670 [Mycobacteriales bacterium]|nr:hypothetical protein [Mycobacteriales bacterium]